MTNHPFASTIFAAVILFLVGAIIVEEHSLVPTNQSSAGWGPYTSINTSPGTEATPQNSPTPQQILQQVIQSGSQETLKIAPLSYSSSTNQATQGPSGSFDYLALLNQIAASTTVKSPGKGNQEAQNVLTQAYAYVPQGLIATTDSSPKKTFTPAQQALFDYGNSLGTIIESYEQQNKQAAEILRNQAEDRKNADKAAQVVQIGKALANVGDEISAMDPSNVPQSVTSMHAALAQSYKDIGARLQLIPGTQNDADFVAAVKTYDAAADIFVRNYASIAEYFSISGVSFSTQDGGSVFSFTQSSGF